MLNICSAPFTTLSLSILVMFRCQKAHNPRKPRKRRCSGRFRLRNSASEQGRYLCREKRPADQCLVAVGAVTGAVAGCTEIRSTSKISVEFGPIVPMLRSP